MMWVINIKIINTQNLQSLSMVYCYVTCGRTFLHWKEVIEPRVPSGHHFWSFSFANMTWVTVAEYLCHNHHRYVPLLSTFRSAFMSFHWLCNKRNTTGVAIGAGTTYPVCLTVVNVTLFWVVFYKLWTSAVDRGFEPRLYKTKDFQSTTQLLMQMLRCS